MFPYDAEVLASSYRLYNTAIWPAQPVALMLALAALWLAVAPRPWSRRAVGVILAAGWLWCGLVFFLSHWRSEEHTSELQSLMRISYAVFCLKKKKNTQYNEATQYDL